ncbi:BlaI/MecI/CopY family transcriptional regulator [Sphingobium sp. CR28]|uniref:BlaI/MecI/CopY family transcriptional regulator n=1 Tax=Sphingobium sp. CR28 TaxID=3400272 RepID=UPI003FEF183F
MAERISDAEHAVMEVLWERSPATATDVAEAIGDERGWSLQTVKTLLSRLIAKEAIAHEPEGRRYIYRPLVPREAYLEKESNRLVDRLFGGKVSPLVAHLARTRQLSGDDIAELEALLKEIKP